MSRFTAPLHWDKDVIDRCVSIADDYDTGVLFEFYGTMATGKLGHVRSNESVRSIDFDEAEDVVKHMREKGVRFAYVMNTPEVRREESDVKDHLKKYLNGLTLML